MVLRRGSQGDDVKKLQRGLALLGFKPGGADGDYGPKTEAAVERFQRRHQLYADGVAGEQTLGTYNRLLVRLGGAPHCIIPFKQDISDPQAPAEDRLKWVRCPADKFKGRSGYTFTTLREDTAEAYQKLYDAVHELGGIITSAGGKRRLVTKSNPNRSRKSMHYVGRAFDMAVSTGLRNPATDPYVLVLEDGRYWNVWCASSLPPEELADRCVGHTIEGGGPKTLVGVYQSGRKTKTVTRVVFNFTQLARNFGFERIPARRSFLKSHKLGGAEWWHFSWVAGLVRGKTTFGEELLRIYTPQEAQQFVYWAEVKNCRWGVNWG